LERYQDKTEKGYSASLTEVNANYLYDLGPIADPIDAPGGASTYHHDHSRILLLNRTKVLEVLDACKSQYQL